MLEKNYQHQLDSPFRKVKGQWVNCNTKDHRVLIWQRNQEEPSNYLQNLNNQNNNQLNGFSKTKNIQSHCSQNTHLSKFNLLKTLMNYTEAI